MPFVYLTLAIILTCAGQVFYKLYYRDKNILLIALSLASFILVPLFSYLALRKLSMDVVYMATSINIILTLTASKYVLNEEISRLQLIGSFFVILGLVIYNI